MPRSWIVSRRGGEGVGSGFKHMPKWWKIAVIALLGVTAVCKFLSFIHPAKLLFQNDPVFNMPISWLMVGAGLLEMSVCIGLLLTRDKLKGALIVFAFAVLVLSYRAALNFNGVSYCPCLGNAVEWWPWLGRHESSVMVTIALWLLLTSLFQLLQRDFVERLPRLRINSSLLSIGIPVGLVFLLIIWLMPWSLFSSGTDEGIELSRMSLLLRRPETVPVAWHSPTWLYAHVFAAIFHVTGYQLWVPRLVTLGMVGAMWLFFPRLMPSRSGWLHGLLACLFFGSWPAMVFLMASATPELPALALGLISAALLPRSREEWRLGRLVPAGVLLALAIWINVAALILIPGMVMTLALVGWKEFYARSTGSGPGAATVKQSRQAIVFGVAAFAIISGLIAGNVAVEAMQKLAGYNLSPAGLARKTADFFSDLGGYLNFPGTILGALLGVAWLWRQRRLREISFVLTLLAMVLIAHFLWPWWSYYLLYLAIPAAVLAGWGVGELMLNGIMKLSASMNASRTVTRPETSVLLGLLVISIWFGFEFSRTTKQVETMKTARLDNRAALEVLNDYQGRVGWIYAHDNRLAAYAGYTTPPELIGIAWQPSPAKDTVLDVVKKYQCEMLILKPTGELKEDEWLQFLKKEYAEIWADGKETIFVAKRLNPQPYTGPGALLKQQKL